MMAWHYTLGMKFDAIMEMDEPVLLPSRVGLQPGERGILWFSTDEYWEPSVAPIEFTPGGKAKRRMTMGDTRNEYGLVRFGIDVDRLVPWPVINVLAKTPEDVAVAEAKSCRESGGDPRNYCGTLTPVPVSETVVEYMDRGHQWRPTIDRPDSVGDELEAEIQKHHAAERLDDWPNFIIVDSTDPDLMASKRHAPREQSVAVYTTLVGACAAANRLGGNMTPVPISSPADLFGRFEGTPVTRVMIDPATSHEEVERGCQSFSLPMTVFTDDEDNDS